MSLEENSIVHVQAQDMNSSQISFTPILVIVGGEGRGGDIRRPSIPFPGRDGRTSDNLVIPRWIYIRDREGRYLSFRSGFPNTQTITFRAGAPTLDCAFETIQRSPSGFELVASTGSWLTAASNVSGERWYTAFPSPLYYPTFTVIIARGSVVYLRDSYNLSFFMSNQLTEWGSPLGRNFINEDSEMEIVMAAVKKEIIDVHYDIDAGQVREAPPLIVLSTTVRNDGDGDAEQELSYTYDKWAVGTWNNTAGIEIGVSTSFKAGIPFVFSANFEISVTAEYSHEWGGEEGVRQEVSSSTKVIVPPKKKARAVVVVRNARIDVGFTYTERVLWSNGQSQDTAQTGIYTNVDSWHVDVEVDAWEDI